MLCLLSLHGRSKILLVLLHNPVITGKSRTHTAAAADILHESQRIRNNKWEPISTKAASWTLRKVAQPEAKFFEVLDELWLLLKPCCEIIPDKLELGRKCFKLFFIPVSILAKLLGSERLQLILDHDCKSLLVVRNDAPAFYTLECLAGTID